MKTAFRSAIAGGVAAAMLFASPVFATHASSVTYKGTPFGASEKAFLAEHAQEAYACTAAPPSSTGRWCQSKTATYGGAPANVIAQFVHDRLVLVTIAFDDPTGDIATATFDETITSQLEELNGKPTEVFWPGQYGDGAQGGAMWKKIWHLRGGARVTYVHFEGKPAMLADQRFAFLQSKEADKIVPRHKPSDM